MKKILFLLLLSLTSFTVFAPRAYSSVNLKFSLLSGISSITVVSTTETHDVSGVFHGGVLVDIFPWRKFGFTLEHFRTIGFASAGSSGLTVTGLQYPITGTALGLKYYFFGFVTDDIINTSKIRIWKSQVSFWGSVSFGLYQSGVVTAATSNLTFYNTYSFPAFAGADYNFGRNIGFTARGGYLFSLGTPKSQGLVVGGGLYYNL